MAVLIVIGLLPAPPAQAAASWWRPRPVAGQTWQWQLSGRLDLSVRASVYDVDAFTTTTAQVRTLHQRGRKVICYVSAGSYENWRPDRGRFPDSVLGDPLDGWPGERWVDIRRWEIIGPILRSRFELCKRKGFDAVEPDNVDGYANDSGFPLTAADQLRFNRRVAALAHRLGLAVGLKNDVEQAAALAPAFDFAVNEECFAYDECGALRVFIRARKPVFHVEYEGSTASFCPAARRLGFTSMRKRLDLGVWRRTC
ncbi:MAG TPA: endo alpha-1,4 polygalactosaminidase [Micromonosporaceae bacterium]|nr:endo alpha-1,4 polygalactosaminidase [Micromonosporaceae bacterium]